MLFSILNNNCLNEFFQNIYQIDDNILNDYLNQWMPFAAEKKTTLTRAGQTEGYIYFIVDGVCKSFYLNDAKEHIMFFGYSPSFCGVVESFLNQTPSKYYLETITDCQFMRLPYSIHEEYLQKHRELETLYRKLTEQLLLGVIERHHQLMAFNVETRFKSFLKRSPHLLQMVSNKDIASYLRIDPTNFSKLLNTVTV